MSYEEDDTEQGLGSAMLGSGDDFIVYPSNPLTPEELQLLSDYASNMGRRMGESLDRLIVKAWKPS